MGDWVEVQAKAGDIWVPVMLDAGDYERLGGKRLSLASHGYAQTFVDGRVLLLHRWILGLQVGDRRIGDHINGDKLDNRRVNLRTVDASGSSQNVAGRGKSRFRGVHPARSGRWCARVKFRGVTHFLGTFPCELQAARAADAKRRELMPSYVPRQQDMAQLYGSRAFTPPRPRAAGHAESLAIRMEMAR